MTYGEGLRLRGCDPYYRHGVLTAYPAVHPPHTEDEDRFRAIIESAIEAEEVERFKGFGKKSVKADKKRKAKAEKVRRAGGSRAGHGVGI